MSARLCSAGVGGDPVSGCEQPARPGSDYCTAHGGRPVGRMRVSLHAPDGRDVWRVTVGSDTVRDTAQSAAREVQLLLVQLANGPRVRRLHGAGAGGRAVSAFRECPRCGGTMYHDGERWTCQECAHTYRNEPRVYVIGAPVIVTVSDDGTVTVAVDVSEIDDLWDESASRPEGVDDATVDADIQRVAAATAARAEWVAQPQLNTAD